MARQILYLHWKAVRMGLLPLVIAAFGLPLLVVQGMARPEGVEDGFYASQILAQVGQTVLMLPSLAAAVGVTLALTTWSWDHQGRHVYALSLPIPRWRYALVKFGAGALLALVPTVALLLGGLVAAASLDLPPLLHAYPVAVTARFLLATLVIFAIVFAFAAGSVRTTVILLTIWVTLLVTGSLLFDFAAVLLGRPGLAEVDVTEQIMRLMTSTAGPFHILAGNWALIDV
jgi:hypothetical protein